VAQTKLAWQSKLVLLLVMPFAAADVVLQTHWWAVNWTPMAVWTVGLSLLLGFVALQLRSSTPGAAAAGAAINASLMYATANVPYVPWRTAIVPVLTVLVLTSLATRAGRARKEGLGTAERRQGRAAAQVAANLGFAVLVSNGLTQSLLTGAAWFPRAYAGSAPLFALGLAALAEAAADTVSSELGQVLGGRPRMIITFRIAEPGTDGAISLAGTVSGVLAAAAVAAAGAWALRGGLTLFAIATAGGVFGLFFDSLLGATLERQGRLNNDLVNFLSTASAAAFALCILVVLPHFGVAH
jgi:uncharacterized protein (TIGR00297 family)